MRVWENLRENWPLLRLKNKFESSSCSEHCRYHPEASIVSRLTLIRKFLWNSVLPNHVFDFYPGSRQRARSSGIWFFMGAVLLKMSRQNKSICKDIARSTHFWFTSACAQRSSWRLQHHLCLSCGICCRSICEKMQLTAASTRSECKCACRTAQTEEIKNYFRS